MAVRRPLVSVQGRQVGQRGARTRQRLLDATEECLEQDGLMGLRVGTIAARAGTSPATFYHYFQNPTEAVLVAAERAGEDLIPVRDLVDDSDWSDPTGESMTRELVNRFFDYWERHQALLRSRNLAAQEHDPRFREVRNSSLSPLTERFAAKVIQAQEQGRLPRQLEPMVVAAAVVAMLERMAAFHSDLERRYGIDADTFAATIAASVRWSLAGAV